MSKYEIIAKIYVGYWHGDVIDGMYYDCMPSDCFYYETDDRDDARRVFDAVTTPDTLGMTRKSFGTYFHHKHPEYDGIYADFILHSNVDRTFDIKYEQLWLNDMPDVNPYMF